MATDLTPLGTASASSEFNASHSADKAIDNNTTTQWAGDASGFPYWWKIDFGAGTEQIIDQYKMQARTDAFWDEIPEDWTFEASNNNSDWDVLSTHSAIVWTQSEIKTFNVTNSTAYRYYRFNISDNQSSSSSNVSFTETEMFQIAIYVTPNTLSISSSVESPNYTIDVICQPNILTLTSQLIPPSAVGEVLIITPNTLSISSSVESPNVISDVSLTPNTLFINSSVESPFFPVTGSLIAKIIHVNPLIAVTDTIPVQIIKIDITDPLNPDYESVTIPNISNAKDVSVNGTGNYVYVTGNDGKVVKVEIADLTNQITYDFGDTDDIITIETNTNFGITYAGTENDTGELYTLDDRSTFKIDSDFTCLTQQQFKLESNFNIVSAFKIDSSFTALSTQTFKMNSDFKCLTKELTPITSVDDIVPINLEDYQVFVDSVELEDTDLILNSISITHSVGEESRASFQLSRKHDQLDTTLEGISSVITNQNTIEIKIKGVTEFLGKISELDCQYSDIDFVNVNALSEEKENKTNKIAMSLPGLTSRLSLYDIMIQNPRIFNPYIDPDNEDNPKKYKGIKVDLGTKIEQHSVNLYIFDSNGNVADKIQTGTFLPQQNWTYFWSPTVKKIEDPILNVSETTEEEDEIAKFDEEQRKLPINERKPWLRTGLRIQQVLTSISDSIQETLDNISKNISELVPLSAIRFFYIGTSLAPVSEDLWDLKQATHWKQAINEDTETGKLSMNNASPGIIEVVENILPSSTEHKYGHIPVAYTTYYKIGEAPFKEISVRNGVKISKPKLVDDQDGLYSIKDEEYDFREYVKKVADLEYEKLKNINGNILPDTSCTFNLTIDSYLYYAISLLTQINVDNTSQSNIYKDTNGFPVSTKSITITSSDRRVAINADNIKSTKELEIINDQFPDENDDEYNTPETRTLIHLKSDMRTRLKVERTRIEQEQRLE